MHDSKKLPLMGLWERKDKTGQSYFSGSLNGLPIKVFPNRNPRGEKSPTHYLFVCEKSPQEEVTIEVESRDPQF